MSADRPGDAGDLACPYCDLVVPTRVLADSVTLVVIGSCPRHGTLELTRVSIAETTPYPDEVRPAAYHPGAAECGRRLGDDDWGHLDPGHEEPHVG